MAVVVLGVLPKCHYQDVDHNLRRAIANRQTAAICHPLGDEPAVLQPAPRRSMPAEVMILTLDCDDCLPGRSVQAGRRGSETHVRPPRGRKPVNYRPTRPSEPHCPTQTGTPKLRSALMFRK